jgi:3-hydroxyisobutyrate dehydrogenase-like beta-hydroxyacid dehydrogenase
MGYRPMIAHTVTVAPTRASETPQTPEKGTGMSFRTIAVSSAGDMGHAVGAALRESGFDVVTSVGGRSPLTRERAERAGLRTLPDLDTVVSESDLFLSILPPALARDLAEQVAAAIGRTGHAPLYADMNAVSPATVAGVAATITAAGGEVVDGGIVGPPPRAGSEPPRFYVSGARATELLALAGPTIDVRPCGDELGRASAVKMCYAALNKGANALFTAVLVAAEALGVSGEFTTELGTSQPELYRRMQRSVPQLAADAWRFAGEMDAATFEAAGVTPRIHQGAADVYRLLDTTPLSAETRETFDRERTLAQTIAIVAAALR